MTRLCKCGRYTTNDLYCVSCQMNFPISGTREEDEDVYEIEDILAEEYDEPSEEED